MWEKPCLNSNEFENDQKSSIKYDRCSVWIHWGCSGIAKEADASKDFVCLLCQYIAQLQINSVNYYQIITYRNPQTQFYE